MIYIVIIILSTILFFLIKDKLKFLKIASIITIISGYLMIFLSYILRILINKEFSFINISKITNIIMDRSINRALIIILIGSLEIITYVVIYIYKKKEELIDNSSVGSVSIKHRS